jgi:hypothetical protein
VAAWAEDGALEGEVHFDAGPMPAERAAAITLMELIVHAWDLAKATGQTHDLDPHGRWRRRSLPRQAPIGRKGGFFGPEARPSLRLGRTVRCTPAESSGGLTTVRANRADLATDPPAASGTFGTYLR